MCIFGQINSKKFFEQWLKSKIQNQRVFRMGSFSKGMRARKFIFVPWGSFRHLGWHFFAYFVPFLLQNAHFWAYFQISNPDIVEQKSELKNREPKSCQDTTLFPSCKIFKPSDTPTKSLSIFCQKKKFRVLAVDFILANLNFCSGTIISWREVNFLLNREDPYPKYCRRTSQLSNETQFVFLLRLYQKLWLKTDLVTYIYICDLSYPFPAGVL